MSYPEACKEVGVAPKSRAAHRTGWDQWIPKLSSLPGGQWSLIAGFFVADATKHMPGAGKEYAEGRGFIPGVIKARRFGWNPATRYWPRESWGLEPGKKLWLPAGLVIPTLADDGRCVVGLKIRRWDYQLGDQMPKYVNVSGSTNAPMILAAQKGKPVAVVESELDAILLAQEAGDLIACVALRTARGKPDATTAALLKAAPIILIALDADEAGAKPWPWWREQYSTAVRWPVPALKDVGDYHCSGGNLRLWIEAGLRLSKAA